MRLISLLLLSASIAAAQGASPAKPARTSPWFNAQAIDFAALIPAPPARSSQLYQPDMRDVLLAQRSRSAALCQRAKADDREEDIHGTVPAQSNLANNTVLIVRHAEKPAESTGDAGLTESGQHRAEAYRTYFHPFQEGGVRVEITALYAGADSASSIRPRLTLEPLSRASGMPLDTTISTKDPASLVALLRNKPARNDAAHLLASRPDPRPADCFRSFAQPPLTRRQVA